MSTAYDLRGTPYPPYVQTEDERERWDLCLATAIHMSELCEPDGVANNQFVWFETRALYKSDIPTYLPGEEHSKLR